MQLRADMPLIAAIGRSYPCRTWTLEQASLSHQLSYWQQCLCFDRHQQLLLLNTARQYEGQSPIPSPLLQGSKIKPQLVVSLIPPTGIISISHCLHRLVLALQRFSFIFRFPCSNRSWTSLDTSSQMVSPTSSLKLCRNIGYISE